MDNIVENAILREVYRYLKKDGYENFKTNLPNFGPTENIVEKQSGNIYKPGLTATHKGSLSIFEIEMGEDLKKNNEKFIKKCKAFLQYANQMRGKFYLVVPVEQFDKIMQIINRNNLEDIGMLRLMREN